MTYLNSSHSEDMIGWKIVSRKNQALLFKKRTTNSTIPVLVTPRSPPFRLNLGTKKSVGNVERGVWFGRRDTPGQLNNDDLSTNYHSRIHSITTIIMLTTVFVFIITLASAAVLVCWCRKNPDERNSCTNTGKRHKKHAFASKIDDDFIPVKDIDDDDDFDDVDDEDDRYDVEACEMREIIRDSRFGISDESDSDCNSGGSGKSYTKLPREEESNLILSDPTTNGSAADSGTQIHGESSIGDLEKDPSYALDIQGQSKFYLLKCIVPRLIRKLRSERYERGTKSADECASEFHDFSHPTDSSYFLVNHSLAREKHSLKDRNLLNKLLFKFRLEQRTKSKTQEVFRLSRNDSKQSLL